VNCIAEITVSWKRQNQKKALSKNSYSLMGSLRMEDIEKSVTVSQGQKPERLEESHHNVKHKQGYYSKMKHHKTNYSSRLISLIGLLLPCKLPNVNILPKHWQYGLIAITSFSVCLQYLRKLPLTICIIQGGVKYFFRNFVAPSWHWNIITHKYLYKERNFCYEQADIKQFLKQTRNL